MKKPRFRYLPFHVVLEAYLCLNMEIRRLKNDCNGSLTLPGKKH